MGHKKIKNISGLYIGQIVFEDGGIEPISWNLHPNGSFTFTGRLEFPEFFPGFEDAESVFHGQYKRICCNRFKFAGIQYRQGKFPEAFGLINPPPGPVSTAPNYTFVSTGEFTIDCRGKLETIYVKNGIGNLDFKLPEGKLLAAFPVKSLTAHKHSIDDLINAIPDL